MVSENYNCPTINYALVNTLVMLGHISDVKWYAVWRKRKNAI